MDPLDVVRAAYAAWNAGDIRPFLHHLHPAVEWSTSGTFPGLAPVYHGHAGVLRWQRDLTSPFARFDVTIRETHVEPGLVTAHVHFDATGVTSGAHVEVDFVNEWHLDEQGLVVRFDSRPAG